MSSSIKRTSLFNRRFALTRKAVKGEEEQGRESKVDSEGFEDLDDYFASPARKSFSVSKIDDKAEKFTNTATNLIDDKNTTETSKNAKYVESDVLVNFNDGDEGKDDDDDSTHNNIDFDDHNDFGDDNDQAIDFDVDNEKTSEAAQEEKQTFKASKNQKKRIVATNRLPNGKKPKAGSKKSGSVTRTTQVFPDNSLASKGDDKDQRIRRSRRNKIAPLEFWANEKVVYGRRESSKIPVIVDIVKPAQAESKGKNKRSPSKKSGKKTQKKLEDLGYKKSLQVEGTVINFDDHLEESRLLAISNDKLKPKKVKNEDFFIQTIFAESSYVTSGILMFPPQTVKPSRNSSSHALIFYVIEGSVKVTIHKTSFVAGTGTHFIVPRGNQYSIRSVCEADTRIFFSHCKDNSEE